ncbi:hypothetical protein ACKVWC_007807 [Pyricularia oryzae]
MDEKLGMEDEAALEKGVFDMGKLRMWPRSEFEISRRKKVWPVEDESQEEGEEGEEGGENNEGNGQSGEVGESNVADIHIVDIHIVEDQHVDADG